MAYIVNGVYLCNGCTTDAVYEAGRKQGRMIPGEGPIAVEDILTDAERYEGPTEECSACGRTLTNKFYDPTTC